MKVKRSFAITGPLDKWLRLSAKKNGMSISAYLTHLLAKLMEDEQANGR